MDFASPFSEGPLLAPNNQSGTTTAPFPRNSDTQSESPNIGYVATIGSLSSQQTQLVNGDTVLSQSTTATVWTTDNTEGMLDQQLASRTVLTYVQADPRLTSKTTTKTESNSAVVTIISPVGDRMETTVMTI